MLSKCLKEQKWHGLQRKNLMLIGLELDKAVACDTNVATGAQEQEIWRGKKGKKLEKKFDTQDQEIFQIQEIFKIKKSSDQTFFGEGFETKKVTKKNLADKSVPEVFKGQAQASGPSAWRRHFDLSSTLKESGSRSHMC